MTGTVPPEDRDEDRPAGRGASGPLAGVRVIELGSVVAGPFAGRLLADLGADVIKVEAPGRPDPLRHWGQESYRGHKLWWTVHARNKRCVTLDLRTERAQQLLLAMVATADVVVENFRPGTLARWNIDYPHMRRANPGIVLCQISGFGQTGPYSQRAGYASVAEAMSGLRALNGYPGQAPPRMGISLGDSLAGMFAVQGVLAALLHRDRTGEGQVVDVALTESCIALLESVIPEFDRLGRIREPGGTRLDGIAPSNLFRSKDGIWVVIAANQDTLFKRLCEVMDRRELATDPRYRDHEARAANQDAIEGIVAEWAGRHDALHIQEVLAGSGVAAGPVYTVDQVVSDPQFLARGMLTPHFDERLGEEVLGPGVVPRFSATPGSVRWAGPAVPGAHNADVYPELLGLTATDLEELADEGVI
ncbi:CoA transferase [Actinomadura sp. NAK00032]|uniref:CaiB/BaiF CoA transferase family protein n=1 Tax=Actinomadura sp. NAK00032 TaxID=2742128 RepID=UPI001590F21B|nr:CaiB/BaiF CoA-transferase family protein [Actinomadura sp. NAK00032]QKW33190.1 CoA transferase [Actinomadura sp. NAK00032]